MKKTTLTKEGRIVLASNEAEKAALIAQGFIEDKKKVFKKGDQIIVSYNEVQEHVLKRDGFIEDKEASANI